MKKIRPEFTAVMLALALVAAASWLVAGPGSSSAPSADPQETGRQSGGSAATPLPDFQPTEKLPAGSAVAFPTDI